MHIPLLVYRISFVYDELRNQRWSMDRPICEQRRCRLYHFERKNVQNWSFMKTSTQLPKIIERFHCFHSDQVLWPHVPRTAVIMTVIADGVDESFWKTDAISKQLRSTIVAQCDTLPNLNGSLIPASTFEDFYESCLHQNVGILNLNRPYSDIAMSYSRRHLKQNRLHRFQL